MTASVAASHPLNPATAAELQLSVDLIRKQYDVPLHFKTAGLEEPPKKLVLEYLEAERKGETPKPINRWILV
jgi:primary-amine oxidase